MMKKIKFSVFVILVFLTYFCAHKLLAFEDIRYDITAQFDPQKKTVDAHQIVSFKNNSGQNLQEIYFRIYPNHKFSAKEKSQLYKYASYFRINPYPDGFDAGVFQIHAVKVLETDSRSLSKNPPLSHKVLKYEWQGQDQTILKIWLDEPLKDGQTIALQFDFSLRVPHRIGRYGWHRNTFAFNRWYPILGILDESGWNNAPDFLLHMPYVSEAAFYRLRLDVPQDFVVAVGCDEVKEEAKTDGRKLLVCSSSKPLRELSLAISKDYEVHETEYDGVTIKSFFFKKDKQYGRLAAEFAFGLMKDYSRRFGSYPYKVFSIAPVYLGYGGSQNAGIIFIDARAYQMPKFLIRYFDFLISHETGHQWWYNMVGNDEFRQLWLDEGINSYWISRYLEEKYGPNAKIVKMPQWMESFVPNPTFELVRTYRYKYFVKRGLDQPVVSDVSSFYEPSLIFTVAYGKGSAVVGMLASYIGEENFSKIMKTYFQRYKFRIAKVEDFIRICQEVTGENLEWFFKEWLYGIHVCDYAIRREKGELIIERLGEISMPVETRLTFEDKTEEIVFSDTQSRTSRIDIPKDKKLKRASVDYRNLLLDIDRVNNYFPRQLDVRLVPLYHGLYDIPVFLKEDAYSWVTGPSFSKYGSGLKTSFQKPGDYYLYAASHYDFNSDSLNSSVGFEKSNFLHKYLSWGVEFLNRDAKGEEEDDLQSWKVYLRRELALAYSLFEINSHLTFYLLHNRSLGHTGFLGSREESRSFNYRQKQETILGANYYQANAGAFPDPSLGYKLTAMTEVASHFLDGDDAFLRGCLELDRYLEIVHGHKLGIRLKAGGGHPKDKYLFYLGSDTELRGYHFKDIKGSAMVLGSLEYRFPLLGNINGRFLYNILNLDRIQGVLFFDTGSAWFNRFNEAGFKKDVGLGLRFYFDVAGVAEQVGVRIDIACPLDGEDKDTHLWVGINHAF